MRSAVDWRACATRLAAALAAPGLDIVHPFPVAAFNDRADAAQRLPDLGRADALGVLIGNTRALWAPFVAACAADPALRASADPVDRYVERCVGAAVDALGIRGIVRWAHAPPPRLPIQRLADATGLAPLSPVGLNVHPVYGPWLALRAAVVLDVAAPPALPAAALPCGDCPRTCGPAFDRARAAQRGRFGLARTWRLWLAVRDACPIGRAHRYDEAQIRYHYARDRAALDARAAGARPGATDCISPRRAE
jgi:methylmalonic aciduria homocystinuria type C protein